MDETESARLKEKASAEMDSEQKEKDSSTEEANTKTFDSEDGFKRAAEDEPPEINRNKIRKMDQPSVAVSGKYLEEAFRKQFNQSWLKNEALRGNDFELKSDPFQVAILQGFLEEGENECEVTRHLEKEFTDMDWKRKQMDLYEFYQTMDLCAVTKKALAGFYRNLKEKVLPLMQELTGIRLSSVSASCSMYNAGDYLLVHDDLLTDRRIAFVFYLSPWESHRKWSAEHGGALELFNADENVLPVFPVSDCIYPRNNQLVFFKVCEKSFHQVGEVTTFEYPRLTINGWFHGPVDQESIPHSSIIIDTHFFGPEPDGMQLPEWINNVYLIDEVKHNVQKKVEMFSEVSLEEFLNPDIFDVMAETLQTATDLRWLIKGPAHLRKYDILDFSTVKSGPLSDLYKLFTSRDLFHLLHEYTELDLSGPKARSPTCAIELQRWQRSCYTVIGDPTSYSDSALDILLYLNAQENVGVVTYLVPDDEGDQHPNSNNSEDLLDEDDPVLLTVYPKDNVLNVVYRAEGTTKFTKYVSKNVALEREQAGGHPYTYILAYHIHFYATLAFIVVIIVIGVPMWWKTTEVYRVPLPYSEIESLDDVPIKATIRMGLFTKSKERRDILLFELRKKFENNFVFNLQLEDFSIDPAIAESAKTPAALEAAILARHPLGLGEFALIEWGKLEDDVLVTSERTAFISESATSLKIYQVLSSWILQEYKLKAILGSKEMQTTKGRQLRLNTAPMQPHYEILISVLNPRPDIQKIHWNARAAAENYITPFLDGLSTIANFTVKTQWVYQVEIHNPQKQIPDESKLNRHYAIQEDALPHVITAFEKKLGNQISNDPAIHLVVYVPPCGLAPLRIYRKDGTRASTNNVEAFTSSKWGGIVLANPPEDAIAKCMENPSDKAEIYISSQDVMPVLLYQLRKIFDLENNIPLLDSSIVPFNSIEPRIWEVDNFVRSNTIYRIHSATLTLQSLIQLLAGIDYIVINDQVGAAIKDSHERIILAKQYLLANRLAEAAAKARRAYFSAERAFFDPSMLALLYFPSEQKYAIYIPLFLPIMIPVLFSFNSITKFLRKRFGKQGGDKQKTE